MEIILGFGLIVGGIASLIVGRDTSGRIIRFIIVTCIGTWLGALLLGNWGPMFEGLYTLPALIGAIILLSIFQFRRRILKSSTTKLKG